MRSIPDLPSKPVVAIVIADLEFGTPPPSLPCLVNTTLFTRQAFRFTYISGLRMCLSETVGLIANVSVDNIWLVGYSENILVANSIGEIRISSTIIVCESIEGQALVALKLSTQERTYDQAFLRCLGINVTTLGVSFTSLEPTTKPTLQIDRPLYRSTPRPTLSTENAKYRPVYIALGPVIAVLSLLCVFGLRRKWCHNSEGRPKCCAVRPPAVSISHPRPHAVSNSNPSLPEVEVEVEGMTFINVEPLMFEDIDEVIRVEVMTGQKVLAGQGVTRVVGVGVMAVEAMRVEVVQDDNF